MKEGVDGNEKGLEVKKTYHVCKLLDKAFENKGGEEFTHFTDALS